MVAKGLYDPTNPPSRSITFIIHVLVDISRDTILRLNKSGIVFIRYSNRRNIFFFLSYREIIASLLGLEGRRCESNHSVRYENVRSINLN